MSAKMHYVFHAVSYYISWLACIKLAAMNHPVPGMIIVIVLSLMQVYWQYKVAHDTKGLLRLVIILTIMGFLVDSIFIYSGLLILAANPFAPYCTSPWMLTLWVSFAIFIFSTMRGLFSKLVLLGVLSLAGFPFAYALGAVMGAASLPVGYVALVMIGVTWAFCMPLCIKISSLE